MAVRTVTFEGANTDRLLSPSIWGRFPINAVQEGAVNGAYLFDDFTSFQKTPATTEGNWAAGVGYAQFSDTGGTITNDTTEQGGAVAIGSDGDNEGCSFRTLSSPFKLGQSNQKLCFEARLLTSTIADTKHNILLGLMEDTSLTATVPITAAGALADKNLVGFFRPETARTVAGTGGAILNTVYKADGVTAVTLQTDAVTLVAATYIKVGFKYEPSGDAAGTYRLSFYQNGTRLSTSYQIPSSNGTDFPNDISLGMVFAVLNGTGTTPGTSSLDWWACGQLYGGF